MANKLTAEIEVDGQKPECLYHTLKKKLGKNKFKKYFPDIEPCDMFDRNSKEYQEYALSMGDDPDFVASQEKDHPDAQAYLTPTGQEMAHVCVNHAKLHQQDQVSTERFSSYARPLNSEEAPDVERRNWLRTTVEKIRDQRTQDRNINKMMQERIDARERGQNINSEISQSVTPLQEALPEAVPTMENRKPMKVIVNDLPKSAPAPEETKPEPQPEEPVKIIKTKTRGWEIPQGETPPNDIPKE